MNDGINTTKDSKAIISAFQLAGQVAEKSAIEKAGDAMQAAGERAREAFPYLEEIRQRTIERQKQASEMFRNQFRRTE